MNIFEILKLLACFEFVQINSCIVSCNFEITFLLLNSKFWSPWNILTDIFMSGTRVILTYTSDRPNTIFSKPNFILLTTFLFLKFTTILRAHICIHPSPVGWCDDERSKKYLVNKLQKSIADRWHSRIYLTLSTKLNFKHLSKLMFELWSTIDRQTNILRVTGHATFCLFR